MMDQEAQIFLYVAGTLLAICVILIFHHGYSHRAGTRHPLVGWERWFQKSDVGNCESCNHEMWILTIGGVAILLLIYLAISRILWPWLVS